MKQSKSASSIQWNVKPANVTSTMKQSHFKQIKETFTILQSNGASVHKRILSSVENSDPSISTNKKNKKTEKMSEDEQMLQDEILVFQFMSQAMLFNPRLKSHRFSGMNAEKWKIIADKIGAECPNADTSITKVKERWTKLRDDYLKRQRLKKQPTGSGRGDSDDEGPLDDLLSGLNNVYDQKKSASNVTYEKEVSEDSVAGKDKKKKIFENGALKIIESSSDKFLSAIENLKDSFVKKTDNAVIVKEDKVARFCDLLQVQLRELDDKAFLATQIQILQVIYNANN